MGFIALMTALVLCARSQDSFLPVSVRRVNVVFLTAGFKGGGKPCPGHVKPPRGQMSIFRFNQAICANQRSVRLLHVYQTSAGNDTKPAASDNSICFGKISVNLVFSSSACNKVSWDSSSSERDFFIQSLSRQLINTANKRTRRLTHMVQYRPSQVQLACMKAA